MSYDFLMFKANVPINSAQELSDETTLMQVPQTVMSELSAVIPGLSWSKAFGGQFWEATTEDGDGRYEFHVSLEPSQSWSIQTSHRREKRDLVRIICKALGVVAFDGQEMRLIDERGERAA